MDMILGPLVAIFSSWHVFIPTWALLGIGMPSCFWPFWVCWPLCWGRLSLRPIASQSMFTLMNNIPLFPQPFGPIISLLVQKGVGSLVLRLFYQIHCSWQDLYTLNLLGFGFLKLKSSGSCNSKAFHLYHPLLKALNSDNCRGMGK